MYSRVIKAGVFLVALSMLTAKTLVPVQADSVDDYMKSQMLKRHIPGLSIAVIQNGKVVKQQGYGFSNVELSVPATAETIYPIGSISKQITAVGIMLLVRDKKVDLNDAVNKYIDFLPLAWKNITVRELLNQTSGIPEWVPNPDKEPLLKAYSLAEIVEHVQVKPLAFTPGTKFDYSNTNFNLLAGIIEKVSGQPYDVFLQGHLVKPIGMGATGIYDPQITISNRSAGYDRIQGKVYNNVFLYDPSYYAGAGSFEATVGDLAKWDAAILSGRILSPSALSEMWTPPHLPNGVKSDYGMGWINQTFNGHRVIWHNGGIPGYTGFLGHFPDDSLTVIILSNMFPLDGFDDNPPFLSLGQGLASFYVPALEPVKEATLPEDPLVTSLLKKVSGQIASGTLDKSLFAPTLRVQLTPAAVNPAHDLLAPLGPVTSLKFLQHSPDGASSYQARYGTTTVNWIIAVDGNHKIYVLRPLPQ